jgi:hypothetical protein
MKTQTLSIKIVSAKNDSLPKQIYIFSADLTIITSVWIENNYYQLEVVPGTYLVQLILASGKEFKEVVEVLSKISQEILIDIRDKTFDIINSDSPKKTYRSIISYEKFPLEVSPRRIIDTVFHMPIITARLWTETNRIWTSIPVPSIMRESLNYEGNSFKIEIPDGLYLLEIENPTKPSTFVRVPPHDSIDCHIKMSNGPKDGNELDVSITLSDTRVQALLTILNSGNTQRAKTFVSPVEYAENLLYQKVRNPIAAAIGGYYLLKTRELDRLHDWARNLANWFDWMPDGAIIYAWQIIQKKENKDYSEVKKLFLTALDRGIPIFTEGLRLLHDGLSLYSYHAEKKDEAVENALTTVKEYISSADLSCEMTTYTGKHPDTPGNESLKAESNLTVTENVSTTFLNYK